MTGYLQMNKWQSNLTYNTNTPQTEKYPKFPRESSTCYLSFFEWKLKSNLTKSWQSNAPK